MYAVVCFVVYSLLLFGFCLKVGLDSVLYKFVVVDSGQLSGNGAAPSVSQTPRTMLPNMMGINGPGMTGMIPQSGVVPVPNQLPGIRMPPGSLVPAGLTPPFPGPGGLIRLPGGLIPMMPVNRPIAPQELSTQPIGISMTPRLPPFIQPTPSDVHTGPYME